ncbi:aminotransferase class I/II-fold pyridoxal phosphate-dependent enzyme [candidate division KSB3 bacterium]|uniref:Aminotransferase class I/II-fold pyridoxal phosphate-dependent enzyme n=1 Tax=candidate division KSB3 bacterium TaxID=2044937 RepID=A0A9D5JXP7_9BACT|nr:aminotransferase class I/II-fold pyridoxal phosphate-dependent enzyme [candidate division KSB3 bacterium]MBD3326229.1 aminotransferase class I/II-fold pyridoxal phosphate-dependent enzyme [candidate division KSB3 bacterium]
MTLETQSLTLLHEALERLDAGFSELPDVSVDVNMESLREALLDVAERMQDNYPYQHPLYAGQMLKPPHPIARLAYMLAMWMNPNNHALDGGRASSAMEKEAVANIARMFGWETHLGHLCGGGTMANMEALWIAGRLHPGKKIVASQQAHYTHQRISEVLHLPFKKIPCDAHARLDLNALEDALKAGDVGTVVATIGTTATGSVDPLPEILELQAKYGFRIHADAAYGGYFILAPNLTTTTRQAFDQLAEVDSLVVDPHKHGLQPYGCGCVLFKDPAVGKFYKHDSTYTYFSSAELHLGEISLECSRAGASAVALWATQRLLPMIPGGEFARGLQSCRNAALALFERIQGDQRFLTVFPPELDIVIWAPRADSASGISARSRALFEAAARENLHLAVAMFPSVMFEASWQQVHWDEEQAACLRSCLMKPEHLDWIEAIWDALERGMQAEGMVSPS